MRSSTCSTCPSRRRTYIAPSPSTRARASVRSTRVRLPSADRLMRLALCAERLAGGVERAERAQHVAVARAELVLPPGRQGCGVGRLLGTEAAVAAPVVGRTERAAAGVRHGAQ